MKVDGARIRLARVELGLTLRSLATECGMDKGSLSRVETGQLGMRPETMRRVAERLGLPLADVSPDVARLRREVAA